MVEVDQETCRLILEHLIVRDSKEMLKIILNTLTNVQERHVQRELRESAPNGQTWSNFNSKTYKVVLDFKQSVKLVSVSPH